MYIRQIAYGTLSTAHFNQRGQRADIGLVLRVTTYPQTLQDAGYWVLSAT